MNVAQRGWIVAILNMRVLLFNKITHVCSNIKGVEDRVFQLKFIDPNACVALLLSIVLNEIPAEPFDLLIHIVFFGIKIHFCS